MKSLFHKEIKIYLADDHNILREGLSLVLSSKKEISIIGESGNGKVAYEEIQKLKPDIAILDISMPDMTGIEIARNLKDSNIKIIILSSYDTKEYISEALKQKILGYVLKEDAGKELFDAIDSAMKGKLYLSKKIQNSEEIEFESDLTKRELEILKSIARGMSNREISQLLGISESTAKVHRTNLMNKLGIHKATDLVKYALKNKLIEE